MSIHYPYFRSIAAAATALVLAGVVGCASVYQQDGVLSAGTMIAVIEAEGCEGANCTIVQEIDGKFRGVGFFKRYELLPGKRTLKVLYMAPGVTSQGALLVEFEAQSGRTYGIRSNQDRTNMTWSPVIFDRATGEIVSKVAGYARAY